MTRHSGKIDRAACRENSLKPHWLSITGASEHDEVGEPLAHTDRQWPGIEIRHLDRCDSHDDVALAEHRKHFLDFSDWRCVIRVHEQYEIPLCG